MEAAFAASFCDTAFGPGLLNVKSSQTREFCDERSPERHIFGHPKP